MTFGEFYHFDTSTSIRVFGRKIIPCGYIHPEPHCLFQFDYILVGDTVRFHTPPTLGNIYQINPQANTSIHAARKLVSGKIGLNIHDGV